MPPVTTKQSASGKVAGPSDGVGPSKASALVRSTPAETEAATDADRRDTHEKVERDSFSMPASEHKRIKALREGLGRIGVLANKSEVLRAGLALLAEREPAEIARLIEKLPKVAKGKRSKRH